MLLQSRSRHLFTIILVSSILLLLILFADQPNTHAQANANVYLPLILSDYDSSWQWQNPITTTLTPAPNTTYPVLSIIDQQEQPHIFWVPSTSPRFIYHTYLIDGIWTEPAPIAETLGTSYTMYPPIIDPSGQMHILWRNYQGSGTDKPYRLMYARFDGQQWHPEEEVYRSVYSTVQGMVHYDALGTRRVTLIDASGLFSGSVQHAIRTQSGWQAIGVTLPGHSISWTWPDRQGSIRFYGSGYPDTVYYSNWRDGNYLVKGQTATGALSGRQTQLDAQGNLHIFRVGSVPIPGTITSGMYYQCLTNQIQWAAPEVVLSGFEQVTNSSFAWQKAADQQGHFALLWEQPKVNEFVIGVWDGCTQIKQKIIPDINPTHYDVHTLAVSPNQVCVIARKSFSQDYYTICADILP